jgi:hypothetical protein
MAGSAGHHQLSYIGQRLFIPKPNQTKPDRDQQDT